ncbi:MAG: oligosaccharide flippase family protein [Chloroflexi bacterium]|nr:oligosaccharide flippase family protein [Chloroflexota bacterium]
MMESGRPDRSPLPSRLSRNTLSLLVSNIGSAALAFLLSVLIGRTLGQDGLGVYAAALAWVFPLSLAAEFGIATLMTRDLAQSTGDTFHYLRSVIAARLVMGGGLMLALLVAAPFLSDHPLVTRGLQLSAPLVLLLPLFSTFTAVFRARQAMWPIPWLNIGMLVAQVALTALVFRRGGDVLAALAVNTFTLAGQVVAAWWVWRRWFSSSPTGGTRHVVSLRELSQRAWPFAAAAVLAALQLRLNTMLLERLTTTAEVGYYAAAARFVEAGRVAPNALFGALLPALVALALQPVQLRRTFQRVMFGLAAFGAVLGGLFALFGAAILRLTYGAAFDAALPALHIAMWSLLPGLLRGGLTLYCFAVGQERFANQVNAAALGLQVALGLALIPRYGAAGAAIASLLVEVAALALLGAGREVRP